MLSLFDHAIVGTETLETLFTALPRLAFLSVRSIIPDRPVALSSLSLPTTITLVLFPPWGQYIFLASFLNQPSIEIDCPVVVWNLPEETNSGATVWTDFESACAALACCKFRSFEVFQIGCYIDDSDVPWETAARSLAPISRLSVEVLQIENFLMNSSMIQWMTTIGCDMVVLYFCFFSEPGGLLALGLLRPLPSHLSVICPRSQWPHHAKPTWEDVLALAASADAPLKSLRYADESLSAHDSELLIRLVKRVRDAVNKEELDMIVETKQPFSQEMFTLHMVRTNNLVAWQEVTNTFQAY